MWKLILLAVILLNWTNDVQSMDNGLARTPPMGWMTWQRYRCVTDCETFPNDCISERLIRRIADAMVREGYRRVGYEYVVIDDCWSEMERESNGTLLADKKRFPNGMKAVGDYIHSKGLKFGLYQDYGTKTCGGYPGSFGFEKIDVDTFAEWGVDYIKLDGCYMDPIQMNEGYTNFSRLMNETGRPMVFSCSLPVYQEENGIQPNFTLLQDICNLWRNYDDIDDSRESLEHIVKYYIDNQHRIQQYAGPGHWNDPDMLLLGNFGLSVEQAKSQMARWAILAAPLLMSNDLNNVPSEFKRLLQNRDVLQVNQDPLGIQGKHVMSINQIEIWTRPIQPTIHWQNQTLHSYAVAFVSLRTDGAPRKLSVTIPSLGLNSSSLTGYKIYDLFERRHLKQIEADGKFTIKIVPNGCQFYKFTPNPKP